MSLERMQLVAQPGHDRIAARHSGGANRGRSQRAKRELSLTASFPAEDVVSAGPDKLAPRGGSAGASPSPAPAPGAPVPAARNEQAPQRRIHSSFSTQHSALRLRRAFTLVELMVTILIIAILAGIFLGAMSAAQQAANVAHTQTVITKLHGQLMSRYEAFRSRRLPISTVGLSTEQSALHRLNAMRELMRMELPDRYSDLMTLPANPPSNPPPDPNFSTFPLSPTIVPTAFTFDPSSSTWLPSGGMMQPTAVNRSFQRRCSFNRVSGNSRVPSAQYEDAECLYLILTTGVSDEAAGTEQVSQADIGDADGDGMLEFHDAWGHPIRFLRWAPGFVSDLQPAVDLQPSNPAALLNHDPFDPLKLQPQAVLLLPLIYSMGRDGIGDIVRPGNVDVNGNVKMGPGNQWAGTDSNGYTKPSSTWVVATPVPSSAQYPQLFKTVYMATANGPTVVPIYDPYYGRTSAYTTGSGTTARFDADPSNSNSTPTVGGAFDVEGSNGSQVPDGDTSSDDNFDDQIAIQ